jgi:hypothetical protein
VHLPMSRLVRGERLWIFWGTMIQIGRLRDIYVVSRMAMILAVSVLAKIGTIVVASEPIWRNNSRNQSGNDE